MDIGNILGTRPRGHKFLSYLLLHTLVTQETDGNYSLPNILVDARYATSVLTISTDSLP